MESVDRNPAALHVHLLGPLTVLRGGMPVALPRSRKVRGLIAYLAFAARPLPRSHLCELLWDLPNDPRGELRWCLSRARTVLDEPGHCRVCADADTVHIDLAGVRVDALDVQAAVAGGIATMGPETLRSLLANFGGEAGAHASDGEFLRGLDIERSAPYSAWLLAQRRAFRNARAALLAHLVHQLEPASHQAMTRIIQWLQLAPFDREAHVALFDALACRGQLREGDEHLAATARNFEAEGQDWRPIGQAWRDARAQYSSRPMQAVVPHLEQLRSVGGRQSAAPRRASLAVMPFADRCAGAPLRGGLADALAYDIITRLAKLRSMFVIAPGTMFALQQRHLGAEEAGRTLNVDYVVSGALRREGTRISVAVQLSEARSARVVWADVFAGPVREALEVLERIGNRVVASVASQVELAERNRAILKTPESLDAWEAHHRGLWHMYRFDRENNDQARRFFRTAMQLDPGFARPYAGLSFTHFQDAFLGWADREQAVEQAYRSASEALMADECDPAAHWALGRAQWLRGQLEQSLAELATSVELSPNFALGHYTLSFVHSQSGDPRTAIRASDHSRELSPFDPLLFAMLASRAISLSRLGRHQEAANWATKAMAQPNAHAHILGVGAYILALAGQQDQARTVAATLKRRVPGYRLVDMVGAFRYADDAAAQILAVAARIGLD